MNKREIIQNGIRSLQVTVTALIFGVIGFVIAGAVVSQSAGSAFEELTQEMIWMIAGGLALLAVLFAVTGQFLFKKKISELNAGKDIPLLIAQYRTALIIRIALCEAPAFLSCTAFIILADYTLLGGAALSLIAMVMAYPKKETVLRQLGMNEWEV